MTQDAQAPITPQQNIRFPEKTRVTFNRVEGIVIQSTGFGIKVRWPDTSTTWITNSQMHLLKPVPDKIEVLL